MSSVLVSFKVKCQRCLTFIIYLIRVIAVCLSEKHFNERNGRAYHCIVESCSAEVVLRLAVNTSLSECLVNSLEMLNSTTTSIHGEDVEQVLALGVLGLDDVIIRVLG